MWIGILRIATVALAGAGLSEFVENIFSRKQTPIEAVKSINWTRVIIAGIATLAVIWIARQFFKVKFDN